MAIQVLELYGDAQHISKHMCCKIELNYAFVLNNITNTANRHF